jgi:hypothetical protein
MTPICICFYLCNLLVFDSYQFHESLYSFNPFKDCRHNLFFQSQVPYGYTMFWSTIVTLCLDPCLESMLLSQCCLGYDTKSFDVPPHVQGKSTSTVSFTTILASIYTFLIHHYSSLSYICFVSMMGDTLCPSFDDFIPDNISTSSGN